MNLNKLLGTEFPFIQGGMANIATGAFAAACSEAGALGVIATGGLRSGEQLREQINICRSLTDKPFGVNLMLLLPYADDMAQVIAEERVPVITTGAGNPAKYIASWKQSGSLVIPVVAAPILAKRLERAGADAVIAEGGESGGHVGDMTTMTLVPQVVDAVKIPVIAAGGVADGRQLLAVHALGACGVQIGTALLTSEECPIHENYKNALIKAKPNDTNVIGRTVGAPVRILKNKMARNYVALEKKGATLEELEHFTLGALRRAVHEGDTDAGSLMAGQVSAQLTEIKPLRAIFEELYADYENRLKELGVAR